MKPEQQLTHQVMTCERLNKPELIKLTKRGKKARGLFSCACGNLFECLKESIRSGNTVSCGCYRKEYWRTRMTRHGEGSRNNTTAEYRTWSGIKDRCLNPNNHTFRYYGGRGIFVCERWKLSYLNFLDDMGRRPSGRHSIDRINNDDGYYKENCRWATKSEQAFNRRPKRK